MTLSPVGFHCVPLLLPLVQVITPTKSTLLPIWNQGEVGPKPKADLLYLVQQATDTSSIFSNQTSSQSLSPKPSEPNSIKKPLSFTRRKLILSYNWNYSCGSLWRPFTTANSGLEILDFPCAQTIQRFRGESLVDSEVEANVHVTYALVHKENRLSHSNMTPSRQYASPTTRIHPTK